MTIDEALALAWTRLAPGRAQNPELPHGGFPRGFWPDVARVAVLIQTSGDPDVELPFRPTQATRGNLGLPPTPRVGTRSSGRGKLSTEEKKTNTLALLARLKGNSNG